MNGYDSLLKRLAELSDIISIDEKLHGRQTAGTRLSGADRNAKLYAFRKAALAEVYSQSDLKIEDPPPKKYSARLFSYIHNEFNSNSVRYLGRLARITHIAFTPLFAEKVRNLPPEANGDYQKTIGATTDSIHRWLWLQSVHQPNEHNSFRGGKDRIFDYIQELFDYSEPFITTKRSVIALKERLAAHHHACPRANEETDRWDALIERAGFSNRLTNTVEFFWKWSQQRKAHFRWSRHNRPYQTLTFAYESAPTPVCADAEDGKPITGAPNTIFENERWFKLLTDRPAGDCSGDDPFELTALHAFPSGMFEDVFGRYVQGAHYLVLPLECFFLSRVSGTTMAASFGQRGSTDFDMSSSPTEMIRWLARLITPKNFEALHVLAARLKWTMRPTVEGPTDPHEHGWRALLDQIRLDPERALNLDHLVVEATRPFLLRCFHQTSRQGFEQEYVGIKCMDGRAYVFSNVRNNGVEPIANFEREELFTRTVIIDCGMNGFERARLVQILSEFAVERVMALLWLARFRLVHNALNLIQARFSLAISNYHNRDSQIGSVVPHEFARLMKFGGEERELQDQRGLFLALEFLSSCLTVLNDVVESGISDRSNATNTASEFLRAKLRTIREKPLIGHQTLTDFLGRQFTPAARTIVRTGERYRRLRQRITEVAELVSVRLQVRQRDEHQLEAEHQTALLYAAEFVAEIAAAYYTISVSHRVSVWFTTNQWQLPSFVHQGFVPVILLILLALLGNSTYRLLRWRKRTRMEREGKLAV